MLRKVPLSDERQASFEEFRARHGQALGALGRLVRARGSPRPRLPDLAVAPAGPAVRGNARYGAATSPRRPSSTPGCSGSSLRRWRRPRRRPAPRAWLSASSPTSPSGRTPAARTRGPARSSSRRASPSAPRRTPSTSAARTGACRPCTPAPWRPPVTSRWPTSSTPTFPLAAACASTTSWACPACGGSPQEHPPTEGAYVYYDAPGTLGTLAAAGGRDRVGRHRRGPGHGRALAARRPGRPRRPGHA